MNKLREIIAGHPFFRGMKTEHIDIVAGLAMEATFDTDGILFREEEPADHCFLIENGRIALEAHEPADGTVLIQYLEAGDVLGWSWLFPPYVWHFTARAVQPTRTIVLSGAHLLAYAEHDHEFGYDLMKRVAQVVIKRLQATRKQLLAEEGIGFGPIACERKEE